MHELLQVLLGVLNATEPEPLTPRLRRYVGSVTVTFSVPELLLPEADDFAALDTALKDHELVKVKFEAFKEQKHELVPQLVSGSNSVLILRVGNVAVLHRPRPAAAEAAG